MNLDLSFKVGQLFRAGRISLCVAESCTGGLLGSMITAIPGSSDYFPGGIICYADQVKRDLLGVPAEMLEKYGAVSSQVVTSMVEQACSIFGTECGIAVSGIAGPAGGTPDKPVGLVYIGIRCGKRLKIIENRFNGDRNQIREQTCYKALETLVGIFI